MARLRRRALLFAAVVALCVGCDHATKEVAERALGPGTGLSLLGDVLRLDLVQNPGAFLSVGALLPDAVRRVLFLGVVPAGLALFCALAVSGGFASGRSLVALGLLAGGGVANWLDRLVNGGAVTDFVSLGLGPLRTGVFNVADVCIVAGVAWLLAAELRRADDATAAVVDGDARDAAGAEPGGPRGGEDER
ncbi:MAG TPA: signal peptidase II [Myxococcota bacterium]|nr:signal peptidase II [Myxococcota bacterium]